MKKKQFQSGFTLIELIVSSLLVVIIVLGIFSINSALNNNSLDFGQRFFVKSDTQTTLNHILNNASLAYTDSSLDTAIVKGISLSNPTLTDPNTFCFHQQSGNGNNLVNYTLGDIWLCYSWTPGNYQINWCAEKYNSASAWSCGTVVAANLVPGSKVTYLGTAYSKPVPTFNSTGGQMLFSITIKNCLNNALSSCDTGSPTGTGISADPSSNPEVLLSGSVIPLQASGS